MEPKGIPIEIDQIEQSKVLYSICTLVSDKKEYAILVDSFKAAGFEDDFCEFIYIDNSKGNKCDAYEGLNRMITAARGKYIILCHQDVELKFDKIDVLDKRIQEVEALDPNWGIISNAGGLHLKKSIERVSHVDHEINEGPFPCKVWSVDENFMLIKKSANLSFSKNLNGFHMYGTDICIIANIIGYNAWVVDFHLFHKSNGNMNESFFRNKKELINKYNKVLRSRYIRSTCTKVYISGSKTLSKIMNTNFMIFFAKLPLKVKKRIKGHYVFNQYK